MRNFAKIVLQNFATKKSEKTVSIVAVTINCAKKTCRLLCSESSAFFRETRNDLLFALETLENTNKMLIRFPQNKLFL